VHGDGRVTPSATVLLRGDTIAAVEPDSSGVAAGPTAVSIDGTGLTLLPGLIDAHVRIEQDSLHAWVPFGITTVRDFGGTSIGSTPTGDPRGWPRVVGTGPTVDGPGAGQGTSVVGTVGEARATVRQLADAGVRFIAVGPRLAPALVPVVASEARARALAVSVNPGTLSATLAAEAGATSIEHLGGVAAAASPDPGPVLAAAGRGDSGSMMERLEWRHLSLQRLEDVARGLASAGVVLVPVLAAREAEFLVSGAGTRMGLAPEVVEQFRQAFPFAQQFVGMFARVGGRVVAGSGAGEPGVLPGAGLLRELELLAACGLPLGRVIVAATGDAASLLGLRDRLGTIEPGKAADLVLVAGNPLVDIRALRRVVAVYRDGVRVF